MRFMDSMINHLSNFYDETFIANKENEAKSHMPTIKPKLKVLEAKWVYK